RRHRAFALEDAHGDCGLVVGRRREDFLLGGRDGSVALDQLGEDAAQRLDAERQRRHVDQYLLRQAAEQDLHALDRLPDRVYLDRSFLACSHASFKRCRAIGSLRRSMPFSFWNSPATQSMSTWSKSSPPRWVSPLVALTSKTPSPTSRMEISKVPPPRSKTAIFSFFFLSRPYASDAAVGSLMMRMRWRVFLPLLGSSISHSVSKPAIWAASMVAWRWASLK